MLVGLPNLSRSYWFGGLSQCCESGFIERFLRQAVSAHKDLVVVFPSCDGITNAEELRKNLEIGRRHGSKKVLVAALCTRNLPEEHDKDVLLLPLDDATMQFGLASVLARHGDVSLPWHERKSAVFWRGGCSGPHEDKLRLRVVNELAGCDFADVALTEWCDWEKPYLKFIPPGMLTRQRAPIAQHFQYKYILIVDGNVIASAHQWPFGSGSVPVMVTHPDNKYWFQKFLVPMVHYVPVKYDLSDLRTQITWLQTHDDEARQIALHASEFAQKHFNAAFQQHYLIQELQRLSS